MVAAALPAAVQRVNWIPRCGLLTRLDLVTIWRAKGHSGAEYESGVALSVLT
jgi:hypothetical protein